MADLTPEQAGEKRRKEIEAKGKAEMAEAAEKLQRELGKLRGR